MEEKLESFVNLLNRQRKAQQVPPELANLPNWAQRELVKHPEIAKPHVNGTANGDTPKLEIPKPEIVVEAKRIEPAPEIKFETKPEPQTKPEIEIAPKPEVKAAPVAPPQAQTAEERVRDPQALLARLLAEETRAVEHAEKKAKAAPLVIEGKAIVLVEAPKVPPAPEKPAPAVVEKQAPSVVAMLDDKIAAEIAAASKKVERPAVAKTEPDKVEPAPMLADAADIVPMQQVIAEAMASPRAGRRPAAYALAAAAVIAACAVVAGSYWYTRGDAEQVAAATKVTQPMSPVALKSPPPAIAAKPTPPSVASKPAIPLPATVAKSAPPALAPKIAEAAPPPKIANAPPAKPETKVAPETKIASAPAPAAMPKPPAPVAAAAPKPPVMPAPSRPDAVVATKPAPVTQLAMLTPPRAPAPSPPSAPPGKPAAANSVASAGEPAWQRNAMPAPAFTGQPRIAIVIDDLGLDRDRTQRAVALEGPVTLSFLAYASDLPKQTEAARHAGHELIVHVPMEPIVRPKFVSQASGAANPAHNELLRRLRWDLSRFDGYVGVNNHMGNRLTSDPDATQTVIAELKARGLMFLDTRPSVASALTIAQREGVPTVSRDILLDDDVTATSVGDRLVDLEKIARQRGTAIAVGHPHDQTLEALRVWLAALPSKGLQLVPLTAIVKEREQHIAGAN